ncbi:MAG: ATP-binding protein [Chloroflexi bacterium]|nr:MAG: ATP-binding protein [Chloroflexota bacterium]
MLLRFRASNILSFRRELELWLVATEFNEGTSMPAGLRSEGRDVAFLPVVAIYGANASGKTNVLAALRWMRMAVLNSLAEWSKGTGVPREPFALDPVARGESTLLEVDIVLAGVRHVYGFEVSDDRVETEWLHVYPHGRRQVWFERDAEATADARIRFPGEGLKGPRTELVALTRPNALFLTVAASFNHPQLAPVHRWFAENLWFTNPRPDEPRRHAFTRRLLADPGMRGRIESLLRSADLGVLSIEVEERDPGVPRIRLAHRTSAEPVMLDFDRQESQGTQAWLALVGPMLSALDEGSVLLADELDSSLHPVLVAEAIRLFNDPEANRRGAQLICTLQDVTLLGNVHTRRPLDRDQVWLTTKGRTGESELYPLTDARPRKEDSLERGYLRGRYGGIPRVVTGEMSSALAAPPGAAQA